MKRFVMSLALLVAGSISEGKEVEVIACDPESEKCIIRVDCFLEGGKEICSVEIAEIYWIPEEIGGIDE